MNTFLKLISVLVLALQTSLLSAGCSYTPGGYSIVGNYVYDTANATYFFNQGDTLFAIYNGTGSGTEYSELYYLNDTILLGSKLDTVKVYREGIYKVEFGCSGGTSLHASVKFLFNNLNSIPSLRDNYFKVIARPNKASSSLLLFITSNQIEYFDVKIFDIQGKEMFKAGNLLSGQEYSFALNVPGWCIISVTSKNGVSITEKITSF